MGGGGGFVSAITDPISDVLGTSGGDGGLLGAVEDVGGFIGDAGKVIDDAVIQPIVDDPVNTAIKLGAYYVGGPLGAAAASAGISAAQGNDIEDIARDAAISYAAGQVGGQVGGAVAGETGSQLAGNLAQGGTSGATSAVLSGRDPVTGLLSGVTGAGISAGVGATVDAGAGLFNQTNTGSTGMDELFNTGEDFNMGGTGFNAYAQQFGGTGEDFNMGGGLYGPGYQTLPGELGDIILDPNGNVVLSSGSDIQAAQSLGFDSTTLTNYAKQFGTQALRALLGSRGGTAGQGGASGNTGLGGLLGGGVNAYLSAQQRQAIQNAYSQQAQQVGLAANRAAQQATFKPVGVTTAFGQSQFQVDPTTGQLTSVGYTAAPEIATQRQRLFGLGAEALPTTADTQAIQQQYLEQQRGLLAPSREQQLAQLRNRQYQRGTGGLATGGTVAGYAPGAGGLMQTNPEMAAYYNALAREDALLGANAPTYAQDLLNKRIATGTGLFTQAGALETMAQQPLTLASDFAKAQAAAGASAGQLGLAGQTNAARLGAEGSLLGNAAMQGTYNQLGQLATGVGNQVGGMLLQNPSIANWLS
jgi:hypothetical protein